MSIREANDKSLARMQHAMQNPGKLAGISWGLERLDNKTGGLRRGEMLVLAGRPGMGKTALACLHCAADCIGRRTNLLCIAGDGRRQPRGSHPGRLAYERHSPIPYYSIANGTLSDTKAERVIEAARCQREWPLTIDPAPGLTVSQIAARARRHSQILERQGRRLGLVIVDHMHIVQAVQSLFRRPRQ